MMKKNRYILLAVMVALFSLFTASAQTDSLWTVSGKVLDAKSRKAMMSVSVTDGRVGTVTNEDGEFTLKLTREPSEVIFSCLGYKSVRLSAAACKAQESQRKPILLQPSTVMLSEVVVEGYEARQILSKAIDKIKVNYPRQPNLLRGFYRETVQKRQRFVAISEGVVDLYKSGYTKSDYRDGVKILKGRRLLSQRSSDTLGVKLQGGPVLPITFDVVKDRDILLNDAELEHYSIRFKNPEMADGRMQYVIELKPRHYLPYALFNALFYIDRESLAFTKVELHLDMSEPEKVTEMILKKRPVGLRFTPRELTVIVDYKTDNGVTRLNYIRNVIGFRCDWKRKLFKSNFTIVSEMVVTECQENDSIRPIRVRDTFNRTDKFYDKVIYFSDPNFWGKENIIEPTEDLLKGIDKIRRRLGR
jgi:uncharacterized protein YegP (UPF0339 family)